MEKAGSISQAGTRRTGLDGNLPIQSPQARDTHSRSLVKAVSWRATATLITGGIVWAITGELAFAAVIGLADAAIKIGIYYLHERAWDGLSFGRRAG